MRSFARTSLGLLGLTLIAPITASAQNVSPNAPAGYQPVAPAVAPAGLDGNPSPAPAAAPAAEAPHRHFGRTLCAKCAAKQAGAMPPVTYVGCEHSKNGVCSACAAFLKMPGPLVMSPGPAASAPGRAVVASAGAPAGMSGSAVGYGDGMGEPAPVGVIQANFSQAAGPIGASTSFAPQASAPGRAVAESAPGRDPYQANGGKAPRPHILGHLFGWSGLGAERAEEKARRKSEAHAMISYDTNGNPSTSVDELPASAVFGKKR